MELGQLPGGNVGIARAESFFLGADLGARWNGCFTRPFWAQFGRNGPTIPQNILEHYSMRKPIIPGILSAKPLIKKELSVDF